MESTFKSAWLEAIAFLSESMQNRIIGIVTRYQITGTLPEKMSRTVILAVRMILADLGIDVSAILPTPSANANSGAEMPHSSETQQIAQACNNDREASATTRTECLQVPHEQNSAASQPSADSQPNLHRAVLSSLPRKHKKALKKALKAAV